MFLIVLFRAPFVEIVCSTANASGNSGGSAAGADDDDESATASFDVAADVTPSTPKGKAPPSADAATTPQQQQSDAQSSTSSPSSPPVISPRAQESVRVTQNVEAQQQDTEAPQLASAPSASFLADLDGSFVLQSRQALADSDGEAANEDAPDQCNKCGDAAPTWRLEVDSDGVSATAFVCAACADAIGDVPSSKAKRVAADGKIGKSASASSKSVPSAGKAKTHLSSALGKKTKASSSSSVSRKSSTTRDKKKKRLEAKAARKQKRGKRKKSLPAKVGGNNTFDVGDLKKMHEQVRDEIAAEERKAKTTDDAMTPRSRAARRANTFTEGTAGTAANVNDSASSSNTDARTGRAKGTSPTKGAFVIRENELSVD